LLRCLGYRQTSKIPSYWKPPQDIDVFEIEVSERNLPPLDLNHMPAFEQAACEEFGLIMTDSGCINFIPDKEYQFEKYYGLKDSTFEINTHNSNRLDCWTEALHAVMMWAKRES